MGMGGRGASEGWCTCLNWECQYHCAVFLVRWLGCLGLVVSVLSRLGHRVSRVETTGVSFTDVLQPPRSVCR